jgi:hypothetical protein
MTYLFIPTDLIVTKINRTRFLTDTNIFQKRRSTARYQMLPIKSKLRYQKELEKFTQWQLLLVIILNIQILLIKLNFNYA